MRWGRKTAKNAGKHYEAGRRFGVISDSFDVRLIELSRAQTREVTLDSGVTR